MAKQELLNKPEDNGLATLQPYDAQIDELESTCMSIKVKDIDDAEGLKAAHEWRMKVKSLRIEVDKEGKRLRADAVKRQKLVLGETNRIIDRIKPIEAHLQEQEDIVAREKERVRQEEIRKLRERTESRLKKLSTYGVVEMQAIVENWSDDEYSSALKNASKAHEEKLAREAEEKSQRERERAELEKQRKEQEAIRQEQARKDAELKAKQDEIDAANRKIEADKLKEQNRLAAIEAEKKRAAELEQARKDAAERAQKEERERIEREELEAKRKADQAERERLEELESRPYKKKLIALADQIQDLKNPTGKHETEVAAVLKNAVTEIRRIAKKR